MLKSLVDNQFITDSPYIDNTYLKKMKRPDALEYFLKEHPEVTEIELCTDNDFAGRWACAQLKEQYEEKYTVVCNLPQMEGADYGDLAKQAVEKQKKQQKERGR